MKFLTPLLIFSSLNIAFAANPKELLDSSQAMFGFSDRSGGRLMLTSNITGYRDPGFTKAFCEGNLLFEIKYIGHQDRDVEKDYLRDSSGNFDYMKGEVYQILNGKVEKDANCLLVKEDFFESRKTVSFENSKWDLWKLKIPACDDEISNKIESAKEHEVTDCRLLGKIDGKHSFAAATYKVKEGKLASVIFIKDDRVAFRNFPTKTGWRVDDGGIFVPAISIIFVLEHLKTSQYEIGWKWQAAEGSSLKLSRVSEDKFINLKSGYRYLAPR